MNGIFISYRRGDAPGYAGRLHDRLKSRFDNVFMDVSGSIEPGTNFESVIGKAIGTCKVVLVVIGDEWLATTDDKGQRRLDDPDDFVRIEVAAALERRIRLIPVLVNDAAMPTAEDLPADLRPLAKLQGIDLSANRWDFDVERLIAVLEKLLARKPWQIRILPLAREYRERLLELAVIGFPSFVTSWVIAGIDGTLTRQPWRIVPFVIPLALLLAFLVKRAERGPSLEPRGPFLAVLAFYVMTFTAAATAGILDLRRSLYGLEQEGPAYGLEQDEPVNGVEQDERRNRFALNRLGDWRYFFIEKRPAETDFRIVTMPQPDSQALEERRWDIARLIGFAHSAKAKGIAFDFYFEGASDMDERICSRAEAARRDSVAVLAGFNYKQSDGILHRIPYPASLEKCFPARSQGHLVGQLDADDRVRVIPLEFAGFDALGVKIAQVLSGSEERQLPSDQPLQFVKPLNRFEWINLGSLSDESIWGVFKEGNFVLVGEASSLDSYETAFGPTIGVVIHAYVVHSLRHNEFIQRIPWWAGFLAFLLCSYILTDRACRGATTRSLLIVWFVMCVLVGAASAVAIYSLRVWLNVAYLLTGLSLLTLHLVALRRKLGETATSETSATAKPEAIR